MLLLLLLLLLRVAVVVVGGVDEVDVLVVFVVEDWFNGVFEPAPPHVLVRILGQYILLKETLFCYLTLCIIYEKVNFNKVRE